MPGLRPLRMDLIETKIEERKTPETIFGDLTIPDGGEKKNAYRYQLYRGERCVPLDGILKTEKTLCFVMLNPSTADATKDDRTIRRCRGYAARWGYQHLYVVNLFAYRTPFPQSLLREYRSGVDVVGLRNDHYILERAKESDIVVLAWGAPDPRLEWRAGEVYRMLRKAFPCDRLCALGLTKAGHPRHPLYVRRDAAPLPFKGVET